MFSLNSHQAKVSNTLRGAWGGDTERAGTSHHSTETLLPHGVYDGLYGGGIPDSHDLSP